MAKRESLFKRLVSKKIKTVSINTSVCKPPYTRTKPEKLQIIRIKCTNQNDCIKIVLQSKTRDLYLVELYRNDLDHPSFVTTDLEKLIETHLQDGYCLSKNGKFILNADEAGSHPEVHYDFISLSYDCFCRLFNLHYNAFAHAKESEVVAATKDHRVMFPSHEHEKFLAYLAKGYSFFAKTRWWNKSNLDFERLSRDEEYRVKTVDKLQRHLQLEAHKSGYVLLKYNKQYALFGFDDGQYFGCLLPPNEEPKTIGQAITALCPKELRKQKYLRQGEWFCLPITSAVETAKLNDPLGLQVCSVELNEGNEEVTKITGSLPIDDVESNKHTFVTNSVDVISDKCFVFYNLELTHDEHSTIFVEGHCKVMKNTAVRSVSQEGVD